MNNLRIGIRWAWWPLVATLAAVACIPTVDEVKRIVILPDSVIIAVGDTLVFLAEIRDLLDHDTDAQPEAWTSTDTKIATVSLGGRLIGRGKGTTTITATFDGKTGAAVIEVVATPTDLPSLSRDVQPILSAKCALSGCHVGPGPEGGMDLSAGATFANTVSIPSIEVTWATRIVPHQPKASFLINELQREKKLAQIDVSHVHRDVRLSAQELATLRAWIRAGAKNN